MTLTSAFMPSFSSPRSWKPKNRAVSMRNLRGDVDRARFGVQRVEIFRECLPVPFQSVGQSDAGDFLDRFHQADQGGMIRFTNGGEADAAIAEQDGADPVP